MADKDELSSALLELRLDLREAVFYAFKELNLSKEAFLAQCAVAWDLETAEDDPDA